MDLSKLPHMSKTPPPPPPENADPSASPAPRPAQPLDYAAAPPSAAAEVSLSIVVGAFLLLMYPRFLQWLSYRIFGTNFNPFVDSAGNIVPYSQVPEFWMDLGPVLFGIVMILDGTVTSLLRRFWPVAVCLLLTGIATAYNLVYMIVSYSEHGLAPISFLAAAFGVYMCIYQWKLLRMLRAAN